MDSKDQLRDLAQEADHAATDVERFAGTAVQYAKDANFHMFNQTIETAIAMAGTLSYHLRELKAFVARHPELEANQ